MQTFLTQRRPWWLVLGAVVAIGCGRGYAASRPADADQGRQALHAALDAWRDGQPPSALSERTPPIQVADDDWLSGLPLVSYKAGVPRPMYGNDLTCPVELTLKNRRGKLVKKRVVYHVGTDPILTVVRRDEQ